MDSTLGDSGVASVLPKGYQSTSYVVTISDVAVLRDGRLGAAALQRSPAVDELCVRVARVAASGGGRDPSVLPSMVVLQASTGVIVEVLEAWEGTGTRRATDGRHWRAGAGGFGLESVWMEQSKAARGRLRGFVDLLSCPVMDHSQVPIVPGAIVLYYYACSTPLFIPASRCICVSPLAFHTALEHGASRLVSTSVDTCVGHCSDGSCW